MLTARSTPEDIARFIEKNAERMAGIEEELGRQLRKLCIRNRMKTAARSVVKTVDGTRVAFLCRYELRGFGFVCYHQMYVSETNEWLSRVYARSDCAFSITAHCVRRYAERCLGDRDMPAEKVLPQLYDIVAIDMESAALAHVCCTYGVPFDAFRVISDNPLLPQQEKQYADFWQMATNKYFQILTSLV